MKNGDTYHIPRLYLFPPYGLVVKELPNNNCKDETTDNSSHNTREI